MENYTEITEIIEEQYYINAINRYGIVPVLLLLEEYERENRFEECVLILKAIEYLNFLGEDFPKRYSRELLFELKHTFYLYGFLGNTAEDLIPYYKQQIEKGIF